MKLSLRWLQRHIDLSDIEPRQVLADLTMSTAEIEGLHAVGEGLECIVVGHVVSRAKHPDADKLSVCQVDVGNGRVLQIVCGAPNVAAGQKVCVILPGDTLPAVGTKGPLAIKQARIRGVESNGMICSEAELGLSDDHSGILVLDGSLPTGSRLVDVLPVKDHVFEIDNKSVNHRPDLWGHHGFARELAAIYGRELRPIGSPVAVPSVGTAVKVRVEDTAACPRYCGIVLDGIDAGPSPLWLRWLLRAVGQRPINLPVDLTNFVMLDLGQPLHAFDLAHLQGRDVVVRRARKGESITTLDGIARTLHEQDLLVCAGEEPEALAGVMGGQGTMVGATTRTIFLESANFHAATVRRTSMRLGLRTEASARFEKSQDPANAEAAVHHFARLLAAECPTARVAGPMADPTGWRFAPRTLRLRRRRLDSRLGVHVADAQVTSILTSLQFGMTPAGSGADAGWDVSIPSFRATKDIAIEDDLVEEVGRMFRYDNIPEQPLASVVTPPLRSEVLFVAREAVQVACTELGCTEAYNYSFTPDDVLQAAGSLGHDHVVVANPVAPEHARIRRHVMPSLLASARANARHEAEIRLVEHGKGYHPEHRDAHNLPREVRELAFVWSRRSGADPLGGLREAVLVLLRRLAMPGEARARWSGTDQPWVHPGRAVAIERNGTVVGHVAALHPHAARAFDLPATTAIATLDLGLLSDTGRTTSIHRALPVFPELPVDLALVVPEAAQVADVAAFLHKAGRGLVRAVELFEVYRGKGVAEGSKSLNFTVTLGAADRTLTDTDEAGYIGAVRAQLGDIGGELRG